jgi:hypothetical protein
MVFNTTFFVFDFINSFLSLKNLTTKITAFRRIDLPSSSGKKGETPVLLDSVDRGISGPQVRTKEDPSFETQ